MTLKSSFICLPNVVLLLMCLSLPVCVRAERVTLFIDAEKVVREIEPGAVGWGAMWKQAMIWPQPASRINTDQDHRAYIETLASKGKNLAQRADLRNISWPWGVSFSTWGVNWENSTMAWSERPKDCARIALLNRGSGWCERTVVGLGDLMVLAEAWGLEALTVAVPLSVLDGTPVRWGPHFLTHAFDDATIEKISDHAVALIAFMKSRPQWHKLQRVYLSAGCEWRHYGQPTAVQTYAKLIKTIRRKIDDKKVIIVASASDSADLEPFKANSWNRPLYEALKDTPGVALDLHRYRGMVGLEAGPDGATAATRDNVIRLVKTGVTQRGYFTVHPGQWGGAGKPMPSVLLENAVHGLVGDHATHSDQPWPWPAVLAHADLVREALASEAVTFLGWTWFPEDLPREWPHGAVRPDGTLSKHAEAQAFLSRYHRGELLSSKMRDETAVRANAVRNAKGKLRIYGGNFSYEPHQLVLHVNGIKTASAKVQYMTDTRLHEIDWDGRSPLHLPPMTLWRIAFR